MDAAPWLARFGKTQGKRARVAVRSFSSAAPVISGDGALGTKEIAEIAPFAAQESEMIKVSVIVPVYGVEKYLAKCVDGLLAQTLNEIELIFVNDRSPDGSLAILRDYEKRFPGRLVVVDSPTNRRQGGARNLGLDVAKGEYVGFIDSDDFAEPTMFEKLYETAKSEDRDVVGCWYRRVDPNRKAVDVVRYNTVDQIGLLEDEEKRRSLLVRGGSVWSRIYRRELLVENEIRFPEKLFYEDNYFVTSVFLVAKSFGLVQEPLCNYRVRDDSTSRAQNSNSYFDATTTFDMTLEKAKRLGLFERYENELEYLTIVCSYFHLAICCVAKFDSPNYEGLYRLRERMRGLFPHYYKNKYYVKRFPAASRALLRLNDLSPKLYAPIAKALYAVYRLYKKI